MKRPINELTGLLHTLAEDEPLLKGLETIRDALLSCLTGGHTILIAGNGGSAADAQHFAAEVVGRYKKERRGYPAIALSTDTSVLTAIGNDYSFDEIFARQVEAFGREGDVFVGFSTSGNSKNVIRAIEKAKEKKVATVAFLGRGGGTAKGMADYEVVVPSDNTPRIQEVHGLMIHLLCEALDRDLV